MMDRDPGPGSLIIHAQALDRLGKPKEALDTLAWYLQRQPDDRSILEELRPLSPPVMRSISPGDHLLSAALRLGPGPPGAPAAGETAGVPKPYKEAIPLQEEEVAEFPEDQEALHYLALLHYWQRDYRASSDIYQRLLEKGPKIPGCAWRRPKPQKPPRITTGP